MNWRVTALAVALVGIATVAAVPQRAYAKLIVESWPNTTKLHPIEIIVFYADGTWEVRHFDNTQSKEVEMVEN